MKEYKPNPIITCADRAWQEKYKDTYINIYEFVGVLKEGETSYEVDAQVELPDNKSVDLKLFRYDEKDFDRMKKDMQSLIDKIKDDSINHNN
jgi:hypothetical protein